MKNFIRLSITISLVSFSACYPASAQFINITWTGGGDGMTWEDPDNWDRNIVPDDENHVAVFDSVMGTILRNSEITLSGVCLINGDNLEIVGGSFEFVGFGFNTDPDVKFDNSTVTVDAPTVINTGPGDDTFTLDLSSSQQFGFTNVTFADTITTNDNDIIVVTGETDSAQLRFTADIDLSDADFSVDGTASVGIDDTFTVDVVTVTDGDLSLINPTSQLNANSLSLNGGSLSVVGDSTPTNPTPTLTGNISSRGGRINVFEGKTQFPVGVSATGGNTLLDLFVVLAEEEDGADFNGGLTRALAATVGIRTNGTASVKFDSVQGADANGVLPYAIVNNTDFAQYDETIRKLLQFVAYVPITTANPGDAAQAVGNTTLTSDADVSVLKVNNANINGGGNNIIAAALLAKGISAAISNATIMPHHEPGNVVNELITHAPVGGDRLMLNADIVDNILPTEWTINAPQAGRVTVNNDLSKTGKTNLLGGTLILNADPGGDDIYMGAGAGVVLNTNLSQDILAGTGPFSAVVDVNGDRTISGDIIIKNNSRNMRAFAILATQVGDTARLQGTVTRGGMGNPIEGQGQVELQLGVAFGDGTIILDDTFDATDLGVVTTLNGDDGRQFIIDGNLNITVVVGDVAIAGIGSATQISDRILDGNLPVFALQPGSSIGTFTVVEDMLVRGSEFTYEAELDDAGNSDLLAIGGTFDISTATDTLDISFFSGSTLVSADYTLATYAARVGIFDSVIFDGTPVANPLLPGAIGGTHRIAYTPGALILTTVAQLPGDFDNDGDVDGNDFLVWQRGGSPNGTGSGDLALWQAQYGTPLTSTNAVPEPSTLCLITLVVGLLLRRRLP